MHTPFVSPSPLPTILTYSLGCWLAFGLFAPATSAETLPFAPSSFSQPTSSLSFPKTTPSTFRSLQTQRIPSSFAKRLSLGTQRSPLFNSTAIHIFLPVLIMDTLPLLGNLVGLATHSGRLTWSIAGFAFGVGGFLVGLPALGIPYVGIALIILQSTLVLLSGANLLLHLFTKRPSEDNIPITPRHGSIQISGGGALVRF